MLTAICIDNMASENYILNAQNEMNVGYILLVLWQTFVCPSILLWDLSFHGFGRDI